MAHIVRLGYKQNPSVSDGYIDFGSGANTGQVGYYLAGFSRGEVRLDDYGRWVRDLTIMTSITGSNQDDAFAKLAAIQSYITQTRLFLEPFGANIPAPTDGSWFDGSAATLTFQSSASSKMVYWEVLDGSVTPPAELLGTDIVNNQINGVVVTLTVNYCSKGARVYMDPGMAGGDFAPPFSITNSALSCGWTFPNTTDWTLQTTPTPKYGQYCLNWSGTASTTTTTNRDVNPGYTNTVHVPQIYIQGSISSGTLTVKLQGQTIGTVGSPWTDIQTFVSLTSANNAAIAGKWTLFQGTAVTGNYAATRLAIISPTGGSLGFSGPAVWRTHSGVAAPTNEYMAAGKVGGATYISLYNIQGSVEAPASFVVGQDSSNITSGGTSTASIYNVILGGHIYKPAYDGPFLPLDLQVANGSANSANWWGVDGSAGTFNTSAGPGTYNQTFTFNLTATTGRIWKYRPRKYRAFLVYAANDVAGITKVVFNLASGDNKTYNTAVPQTYTGTTTPTASQYQLFELGDFLWPRPGVSYLDQSTNASSLINGGTIRLYHPGNSGYKVYCSGILLIPTEQYCAVNADSSYFASNAIAGLRANALRISTEPKAPKVSLGFINNIWQMAGVDRELPGPNSLAIVDNLKLVPGDSRYEMLLLGTKTGQQYSFDLSVLPSIRIDYSPRYPNGVA